MTERQITHWVGDECEGGHRTLVERLRVHARGPHTSSYVNAPLAREAADRLERMEAVVAEVRLAVDVTRANDASGRNAWAEHASLSFKTIRKALAALDAQINNPTHADKVRCPNCAEKDANIAELIETLQRMEAAKEKNA